MILERRRDHWIDVLDNVLGVSDAEADFDLQFLRQLVKLLDDRGYPHIAFALLRSAVDLASGKHDRREFDALIGLAGSLVAPKQADRPKLASRGPSGG